MPDDRTIAAIDRDLSCERAILLMERRAGAQTNAVNDALTRIDALLEERSRLNGVNA